MRQSEKQIKAQNRNNYIRTLRAVYWANMRYDNNSLRFAKHIETELKRIGAKTMDEQHLEFERFRNA